MGRVHGDHSIGFYKNDSNTILFGCFLDSSFNGSSSEFCPWTVISQPSVKSSLPATNKRTSSSPSTITRWKCCICWTIASISTSNYCQLPSSSAGLEMDMESFSRNGYLKKGNSCQSQVC